MTKVEVMNMAYRSFYICVQKQPDGNIRIFLNEVPMDDVPTEIVYPKQMSEVRLWQNGMQDIGVEQELK